MILVGAIFGILLPDRLSTLQAQQDILALQERRLAIMEENLRMYEENIARLSLYYEGELHIIQPAGHMGTLVTEIRALLDDQNLSELGLYVGGHSTHYTAGIYVSEIRGVLTAEGSFNNLSAFIKNLTEYHRYVRIERIQLDEQFYPTRLWINFSAYEEVEEV